ncbi:hypothetical protein, partial [Sansalvadorimonas verongulae]|uniref:hypothetical protein n=1 Tax=Sansalvadorimonas verongulae TaxID=2172824 RepID=UPI0012BBD167
MATYIGSGTAESPYLIQTPEQFRDAFKDQGTPGTYYEVTNDIDMGGMVIGGYYQVRARIDGKGHVISNAKHEQNYLCQRWWGSLKNIHIIMGYYLESRKIRYFAQSDGSSSQYDTLIENVRLEFTDAFYDWNTFRINVNDMVNLIVNENLDSGRRTYWCTGAQNSKVDVSATDTQASSYPGIDTAIWNTTGGAVPVLIPQTGDYSGYTHVMGKTLVDGVARSRQVRAVSADKH